MLVLAAGCSREEPAADRSDTPPPPADPPALARASPEPTPTAATASAPAEAAPLQGLTLPGGYRVGVTPVPEMIPVGRLFELDVRVETAQGDAAEDVRIRADAGMPHHGHGMNVRPVAIRTGPATHRVQGMLFHMPGTWDIYVDVIDGPYLERARFIVEVE